MFYSYVFVFSKDKGKTVITLFLPVSKVAYSPESKDALDPVIKTLFYLSLNAYVPIFPMHRYFVFHQEQLWNHLS